MKKIKYLLCVALSALFIVPFTACGNNEKIIKVGASATPHAEILEFIKEDVKKAGFELKIIVYDNYIIPNIALNSGDLDANYFQHEPYLLSYNSSNQTELVSAGKIHYEPMGVFGKNINNLNDLKPGDTVLVPNDPSNCTRALLLLSEYGVITLPDNASAYKNVDITEIVDTKGLVFKAIEAALIPIQFNEFNRVVGVVNGNCALNSGLKLKDAIALENSSNQTAVDYANVIAVKKGDEQNEKIKLIVDLLKSDKVKKFIEEKYQGAVRGL